jgi:hypothetical protein
MDYMVLWRNHPSFTWNEVPEDFISLEEAVESLKKYEEQHPELIYILVIKLR